MKDEQGFFCYRTFDFHTPPRGFVPMNMAHTQGHANRLLMALREFVYEYTMSLKVGSVL